MLSFPGSLKVYLAVEPCDIRKSLTGFYALADDTLKLDPKNGSLFVFCRKRRNRIKILYFDGTGLWVMAKHLEAGTFSWPKPSESGKRTLSLTPEALAISTDGIDLRDGCRRAWHEQFRFPRMIDFFRDVPTFWSKDDHDFRCNDSDNSPDRLPSSKTGIDLFKEQLPIASQGDDEAPTFRTVRVSRDLQIWLTEGRDYRSPNKMEDGPGKTQWGNIQRLWLERTLKASDAKWKLIISPTPMVGPDDAKKRDNHTNLGGFRHEADEFFAWLTENQIENLFTICGDRHWQYHSIHPAGIEEFAAGALNDENSRFGVAPGDQKGTDPDALIEQLFISPEPSGGFLVVSAGRELLVRYLNDEGEELYSVRRE